MTPTEQNGYLRKLAGSAWLQNQVPWWIKEPADRADIAREVWCAASTWDPTNLDVHGFERYLKRALRNAAINLQRRDKKHEGFTEAHWDRSRVPVLADSSPEGQYEMQQRAEIVRLALLEVPLRRRQFVYLRYFDEFSLPEISRRMGPITAATLKKEVMIGMEQLEEAINRLTKRRAPRRRP
jgi:RNA polymerase sigma factor (sigma-70 family)